MTVFAGERWIKLHRRFLCWCTYSREFGNFQNKKHTFSEGYLELPYGPGLMSHKDIWLVCAHSVLRTPKQLLLTDENDQVTCKNTFSWPTRTIKLHAKTTSPDRRERSSTCKCVHFSGISWTNYRKSYWKTCSNFTHVQWKPIGKCINNRENTMEISDLRE